MFLCKGKPYKRVKISIRGRLQGWVGAVKGGRRLKPAATYRAECGRWFRGGGHQRHGQVGRIGRIGHIGQVGQIGLFGRIGHIGRGRKDRTDRTDLIFRTRTEGSDGLDLLD